MKKYFNLYLLATLFIVLIIILFTFHLNAHNVTLPLWYAGGDDFCVYFETRNVLDSGWNMVSDRLGAPFTTDFYDFPPYFLHNFDLLILKIVLIFTSNIFLAVNISFVLTGALIGTTAFVTLREYSVSNFISLLGASIYATLPYYFYRGIPHFVLTTYEFVPICFLICFWIYNDIVFTKLKKEEIYNKKNWLCVLFALCIANNGIGYYTAFTCFFILITGVLKCLNKRSLSVVLPGMSIILLIAIFFFANFIPAFLINAQRGRNDFVAHRARWEADIYGLKITHMLLPENLPHKSSIARHIQEYTNNAPSTNENRKAYLGVVGSLGFIILLIQILKIKDIRNNDFLLSRLNVAGVLLATLGGFGALFAVLVSPMLRAYNRISVYIAFMSIAAFCFCCDRFISNQIKNKKLAYGFISAFFVASLLVQLPNSSPNFNAIAASLNNDKLFVQNIENLLPAGAMIYQLPYHKFPEAGPVEKMNDYNLFTGFLYSKNLKWSYGAVNGRAPAYWHERINSLPIETRLKVLSLVGFEGIYIDTRAYKQHDLQIINTQLTSTLGDKPLISSNGNLEFYSMISFNKKYLSQFSQNEIELAKKNLLNDIIITAKITGIYGEEHNGVKTWRWMDKNAEVEFINNGEDCDKQIKLIVASPASQNSKLNIMFNKDEYVFNISSVATTLTQNVKFQHGRNIMRLSTDANKINAPNDSRSMYVVLFNTGNFIINNQELKYLK